MALLIKENFNEVIMLFNQDVFIFSILLKLLKIKEVFKKSFVSLTQLKLIIMELFQSFIVCHISNPYFKSVRINNIDTSFSSVVAHYCLNDCNTCITFILRTAEET